MEGVGHGILLGPVACIAKGILSEVCIDRVSEVREFRRPVKNDVVGSVQPCSFVVSRQGGELLCPEVKPGHLPTSDKLNILCLQQVEAGRGLLVQTHRMLSVLADVGSVIPCGVHSYAVRAPLRHPFLV